MASVWFFMCQLCHKTFARSGQVREHMRTHTCDKPQMCQVFQKTFAQGGHMKVHFLRTKIEGGMEWKIKKKTKNDVNGLDAEGGLR